MRRALLLIGLAGCTCDPDSAVTGTTTGGAGGTGAGTTATWTSGAGTSASSGQATSSGAGGESLENCPGWPGWYKWNDAGRDLPLCYAGSADVLPEPIEWEPCPALAGMPTGCEQMKVTWPAEAGSAPVSPVASLDRDPITGALLIQLNRNARAANPPYTLHILAEVDGSVRNAVVAIWPNIWTAFQAINLTGLRKGRSLFSFSGHGLPPPWPDFILGIGPDQLKPTLEHAFVDVGGPGISTSDKLWGTTDSVSIGVAEYGGDDWHVISPFGLQQVMVYAWDDMLFWRNSDGNVAEVRAWRKDTGVITYLSYLPDSSQSVYAFGTDGEWVSWVHGHGKPTSCLYDPVSCPFAAQDIMVSPFTKDPAALEPRRLRSFPTNYLANSAMSVGCGYVGYGYLPGKTLIVRASDGYWWELPSSGCTPPNVTGDWCFEDVLEITCDEVFVGAGLGTERNIARVKFSALGPMQPPD